MNEQVGIDISDYLKAREGVASIVKLNGKTYYARRAFNPRSGEPDSQLVEVNRASMQKILEAKQADVAIFTQIIADIDAAAEKLG